MLFINSPFETFPYIMVNLVVDLLCILHKRRFIMNNQTVYLHYLCTIIHTSIIHTNVSEFINIYNKKIGQRTDPLPDRNPTGVIDTLLPFIDLLS